MKHYLWVLMCMSSACSSQREHASRPTVNTVGAAPTIEVPIIEPRPEDVGSIDGIMHAMYAVRNLAPNEPRPWARERTLLAPWIHFVGVGENLEIYDYQRFVNETDAMVETGFREREIHRSVRQFGGVAHVESTYETRYGLGAETEVRRGVNQFQLYFDGARWWIASIVWQNENDKNPITKELLAR